MYLPKLMDLDCSRLTVAPTGQGICVYNKDRSNKKIPLHIKTGPWVCPYGVDDKGGTVIPIPDDQYFKLEEIDTIGRAICRMFYTRLTGEDCPEDDEDLPYKSILHKDDDTDTIHLPGIMSDSIRVFDKYGDAIPDWTSYVASNFTSYFLLNLSTIKVYNGTFFWSIWPVQMKIMARNLLPVGSQVFTSIENLREALKDTVVTVTEEPDIDCVIDFDPDVNELL